MNTFESQQQHLWDRVNNGEAKFVCLDPAGTSESLLGTVIESKTGVVYATQCGGTACRHRLVEGYFIPLGGCKIDAEGGDINPTELRAPFHRGRSCAWDATGETLRPERLEQLRKAIASIPCWETFPPNKGEDRQEPLQIDETRLAELCEAWVPVLTANGRGILLWANCD
jgi:hypothetical protein